MHAQHEITEERLHFEEMVEIVKEFEEKYFNSIYNATLFDAGEVEFIRNLSKSVSRFELVRKAQRFAHSNLR